MILLDVQPGICERFNNVNPNLKLDTLNDFVTVY